MNKVIVNCINGTSEIIPLSENEILEVKQQYKDELQRYADQELALEQLKLDKIKLLEKLGITDDEARLLLL